jgi:hypothetical protein
MDLDPQQNVMDPQHSSEVQYSTSDSYNCMITPCLHLLYLYYMATKGCLGQGFLVPYTFAPFMVRSLFSEQLLSLFGTTVSGSGFRTSVLFIRIIVPKCCGSWMFIPDSKFFHPRIRIFSILDPHPLPSKKFSILTQNNGLKALGNMIRVFHPGSES